MQAWTCDTSFSQTLINAGYRKEALNLWLTPCHHHVFAVNQNSKLKITISDDCTLLAELSIKMPSNRSLCAQEIIKVISSMQQKQHQAA